MMKIKVILIVMLAVIGFCFFAQVVSADTAVEWYNKGNSFGESVEYEKAIECYNRAIELNPTYAQAYNNRGNVYYDLNQYERAIEDYNKAIELDPNYAYAYVNRGIAYKNLMQYERAIEDYKKAIELDPNYAYAYNNKGKALYDLKRYEEAIACYNIAIQLNPNDADAYNNKGKALYDLGRYEEAIACYNKAIQLNSNDADAYNNQGNVRSFFVAILTGIMWVVTIFAIYNVIRRRSGELKIPAVDDAKSRVSKIVLSDLKQRIKELENGSLSGLGEEKFEKIISRLSELEKVVEPIKNRSAMTSHEYHFLLAEFNRIIEREKIEREKLDAVLNRQFNSFSSNFSKWIALITLIISIAISSLFYQISRLALP